MPSAVKNNTKLSELATQPLLNHLMAIADVAELSDHANVAEIYEQLLIKVYARSWGNKQIPILRGLTETDFQRLFEGIGLAFWQYRGGRTTTLGRVAAMAKNERPENEVGMLRGAVEFGALVLITAFFFKQVEASSRNPGRGSFEVAHKSFGEYLAAARIMRAQ